MANFTEKEIKNAFLRLLDEKPLSRITVKQIVEECGINRNSFYYHFQDIPALIENIVTDEADRIIADHTDINTIDAALEAVVDFASQNRRAILHIFNSVNRDIFERYLWKVCDYVISTYAGAVFSGVVINEFDREVIFRFYRCECFGFAIEWMNEQMVGDIQSRIRRFCELHRGIPEEMIRRCSAC